MQPGLDDLNRSPPAGVGRCGSAVAPASPSHPRDLAWAAGGMRPVGMSTAKIAVSLPSKARDTSDPPVAATEPDNRWRVAVDLSAQLSNPATGLVARPARQACLASERRSSTVRKAPTSPRPSPSTEPDAERRGRVDLSARFSSLSQPTVELLTTLSSVRYDNTLPTEQPSNFTTAGPSHQG